MRNTSTKSLRWFTTVCSLLSVLAFPAMLHGEASAVADAAFRIYTASTENRLALQHASTSFLASKQDDPPTSDARLQHGEVILQQIDTSSASVTGALLHHWRGTAFAPGATAADFERLMRNFAAYPQRFAPDVTQTSLLSGKGDHWLMRMRVRQHHVITVVLDGTYDVTFSPLDTRRGYSISRSTHIDEIAPPGTPHEHPLSPHDEHGFLWRQNTYWTYEERDGGLYLQIESVSLTRAIPRGLGWAVRPYVESIPRESLEFTLRSAANAIRK